MLHHLVPDEVAAGSLAAQPRLLRAAHRHGSSLSPGIHAALFARAGRLAEALEMLRLCRAHRPRRPRPDDRRRRAPRRDGQPLAGARVRLRRRAAAGDALAIDPPLARGWEGARAARALPRESRRLRIRPEPWRRAPTRLWSARSWRAARRLGQGPRTIELSPSFPRGSHDEGWRPSPWTPRTRGLSTAIALAAR